MFSISVISITNGHIVGTPALATVTIIDTTSKIILCDIRMHHCKTVCSYLCEIIIVICVCTYLCTALSDCVKSTFAQVHTQLERLFLHITS